MAIGDNIPKLFGNLAETSMKSGGDFEYYIDLLNDRDADQQLALRNEEMTMGPQGQMQGPLIDQFLAMTGDPQQSTSMVIDESISAATTPDDTERAKSEMAAALLYQRYPGTIDQSLISDVANGMDINENALVSAYQDINTQEMMNADNSMRMNFGEGSYATLPSNPNVPAGGLPPITPSPQSRNLGRPRPPEYETPGFNLPIDNIEMSELGPMGSPFRAGGTAEGIGGAGGPLLPNEQGTRFPVNVDEFGNLDPNALTRMPEFAEFGMSEEERRNINIAKQDAEAEYLDLVGQADVSSQFLSPDITLPEPSNEFTELQDQWNSGKISPDDLELSIRDSVIAGMDIDVRDNYGSDPMLSRNVDDQVDQIINQMGDADVSALEAELAGLDIIGQDDTATQLRGTETDTGGYRDRSQVFAEYGMNLDQLDDLSTGEFFEGFPETFYGLTPSEQWSSYMPSVVEDYYAPQVSKSLGRAFTPFYGQFLLSPEYADDENIMVSRAFPDFMTSYQPEKYPIMDWSKFQPQWDKLLDYAEIKDSADPDAIENWREQNPGLHSFVEGSTDAGTNVLAMAMARYNEGRPGISSYSSRGVQSTLQSIFDRQLRRGQLTGETDSAINFLASLAEANPRRFGR